MQSKAKTVKEYLNELPPDRKAAISAVREVILKNLPKGCEETIQYGMIGYVIPHRVYPAGYHCDPKQPLPFICLASQKNHMAIYLMNIYMNKASEDWFKKAYKAAGKKLDMGKSCIRFKKEEDLALDVIGQAVARQSVKEYIALYEKNKPRK
ncbi:MAG TPA: DUF1801 domain-containing protein [Verrucomicrobiae bacterium]|nr:DUF1801 domain-containing protein [Verrucomicrobiae bacterium]